jgi:ABC-type multidrug transport system ATPase subunit/pSer/pThr/pTyr-binding forkhead associated (FHA) protein
VSKDNINRTTLYQKPAAKIIIDVAHLMIFDGTAQPIEMDLADFSKNVMTFGRGEGNDIQLRSGYVSRSHGQIRLINGKWVIEDLGSRNGLVFNGQNIMSRVLEDGDSIRIDDGAETTVGGVLLVFSQSGHDAAWKTVDITNHGETTIGRDPACSIVLDHVSVSKIHAKIIKRGDVYIIVDFHSTNGLMINGKRIVHPYQLREKDLILITNSKLIFNNGQISYHCFKKGIRVDAFKVSQKVGKNRKTICSNVTLNIKPCELVAIIGGSGAGKSTLMNCISGYSLPTEGRVAINGMDLYGNFSALKNIIGYVPQQDIVFDNLTVKNMLHYAAKLRLPKDVIESERQQIIARVLDNVELTAHKDKLIKNLSGGQKKRASIAVELLADPTLFFLDEPTSGLDPGTERNLIKTLKTMAESGKTVVFVTHSTLNLRMCDKIVFMGTGGHLCFCGTYEEALEFFAIDDVVDVYNLIADNPQVYSSQYLFARQLSENDRGLAAAEIPKQSKRHGRLKQVAVLSRRHMHIMINDRVRLILLLVQAPVLALLIALVANDKQFTQYEMTKSLLFAMACSAFWIGILNSIQEICKERIILKREYMTGLRLDSYLFSKTLVMGLICLIQAFLLTTVFVVAIGKPDEGVLFGAYPELLLTTFLTALAASSMGLFVSSLFKNADRAMTAAPLLLMPQLLFSGMIFVLDGPSKMISWLAVCRFSMEAYGTTANLNSLSTGLQLQGFMQFGHSAEDFYTFSTAHFAFALGLLCAFVVAFLAVAGLVLRGIKK